MKTKKPVVCFVSDNTAYYQIGGGFKSPLNLANNLSKKYKIIFITSKNTREKKSKEVKGNITFYRFPSITLPRSNKQFFLSLPSRKSIRKILKEGNVKLVHVHSPFYGGFITIDVAKELKIPVVITNHTQAEAWAYNANLPNIKFIINIVYRYLIHLYNKSDIVVSVSNFGKRLLKKHGLKTKCVVISNGVNLERFKPRNRYIVSKLLRTSLIRDRVVLYIGRLHNDKNPAVLIKAFKRVLKNMNATLIIIGAGYLHKSLRRLSEEMGVNNKIIFLQDIPERILPFYYNISDLFVLPSNVELQGMVVLEAMASGKPVIVSDSKYNAAQELVKGNGFIFKANDHIDLSKKIIKILNDNKLRDKMGKKSLYLVKQHDISKIIDKYSDMYNKLLKKADE
jgi:glycosyltransferase involved in cell wall biosynthesis